jgi:hypothetical protein
MDDAEMAFRIGELIGNRSRLNLAWKGGIKTLSWAVGGTQCEECGNLENEGEGVFHEGNE